MSEAERVPDAELLALGEREVLDVCVGEGERAPEGVVLRLCVATCVLLEDCDNDGDTVCDVESLA